MLMFPAFDGCQDTPVEILHVFLLGTVKYLVRDFMKKIKGSQIEDLKAYWTSFNTDSLNMPSHKPSYMVDHYQSFIGKDFKKVLQAAPFVYFPFMNSTQRALWSSMCVLGSYIFQTRIENLENYIRELKIAIDNFMYHVIKSSAQWVNKPKFHMLLHLPESVRRFGPPSLFASEKFESYNGVLRAASIHSNRHSPGRDIANTFSNYQAMRLVLSGAYMWDDKSKKYTKPSHQVTELFKNDHHVQKLMGLNEPGPTIFPELREHKVLEEDIKDVPEYLKNQVNPRKLRQVSSIRISDHDKVEKGYFVLESQLVSF